MKQNYFIICITITIAIAVCVYLFFDVLKKSAKKKVFYTQNDEKKMMRKVANSDNSFVLVYNERCGHCKNSMPAFEALVDAVNSESLNIDVMAIQPDFQTSVFGPYNSHHSLPDDKVVTGFPAYMLFKNGKYSKDYGYDEAVRISSERFRSTASMLDFIKENI